MFTNINIEGCRQI